MKAIRRFWPLALMLAIAALVFAMGWHRYLAIDTLRDHGLAMRAFVADNYLLSLLLLIVVFALLTASVVPGVFFVTVAAGYLFGVGVGGVATTVAATIGALMVYGITRSAMGGRIRERALRDPGLMRTVCQAIDRDTFWYVLATRLAVVVPFHMINVAAGVMCVRILPYTTATLIGLLPAHLIYCWIGSRLGTLLRDNPDPDVTALFAQFWAPLLGVFVLGVVLPVAMRAIQSRLSRKPA